MNYYVSEWYFVLPFRGEPRDAETEDAAGKGRGADGVSAGAARRACGGAVCGPHQAAGHHPRARGDYSPARALGGPEPETALQAALDSPKPPRRPNGRARRQKSGREERRSARSPQLCPALDGK